MKSESIILKKFLTLFLGGRMGEGGGQVNIRLLEIGATRIRNEISNHHKEAQVLIYRVFISFHPILSPRVLSCNYSI